MRDTNYTINTHDELSQQAARSFGETDLEAVTAAFVASLSRRNLPARSAFGSYIVLQHFVHHDFVESQFFASGKCAYCGLPKQFGQSEMNERVTRYPFQVQHTDIQYAAHDLATFNKRIVDIPTDDDIGLLHEVFNIIYSLPATAQLTELNKSLQSIIKSNKQERMILLETFGYAGILCPESQQNYSNDFVTYDFANRSQPQHSYKREWAYPVRFWTGADGINEDMITYYFSTF